MWTKIDDKCQKGQFFVYFGLFLWLLQMMARKLSRTRILHFIFTIKHLFAKNRTESKKLKFYQGKS